MALRSLVFRVVCAEAGKRTSLWLLIQVSTLVHTRDILTATLTRGGETSASVVSRQRTRAGTRVWASGSIVGSWVREGGEFGEGCGVVGGDVGLGWGESVRLGGLHRRCMGGIEWFSSSMVVVGRGCYLDACLL